MVGMEIRAVVHNGPIRLPASVEVPDGTAVRVLVDDDALATHAGEQGPVEHEPLDEAEVMADLGWATGGRFS
jgi:hypothetical protein